MQKAYGEDVDIVSVNPPEVQNETDYLEFLHNQISTIEKKGQTVVAVETVARFSYMADMVHDPDIFAKGVDIIRMRLAESQHDDFSTVEDGRQKVRSEFDNVMDFKGYEEYKPHLPINEFLTQHDGFVLPQENPRKQLRSLSADVASELGDLHAWCEKLLDAMSREDWSTAETLICDGQLETALERVGLSLQQSTYYLRSVSDIGFENNSTVQGDAVYIESFELSNDFQNALKQRGVDIQSLEDTLRIANIFSCAEECLHAVQLRSGLLSSYG